MVRPLQIPERRAQLLLNEVQVEAAPPVIPQVDLRQLPRPVLRSGARTSAHVGSRRPEPGVEKGRELLEAVPALRTVPGEGRAYAAQREGGDEAPGSAMHGSVLAKQEAADAGSCRCGQLHTAQWRTVTL